MCEPLPGKGLSLAGHDGIVGEDRIGVHNLCPLILSAHVLHVVLHVFQQGRYVDEVFGDAPVDAAYDKEA